MSQRINHNSQRIYRHTASLAVIVMAVLLGGCFASNADQPLDSFKSLQSESSDNESSESDSEDDFLDDLEDEYETTAESIVEDFTPTQTALWKQRMFKGKSEYRSIVVDQRTVLEATTNASASLLFRQNTVDLKQTPVLEWTWKISKTFKGDTAESINERSKAGDDFPARIYVVFRNGPLPGNAMAINYVWASSAPVGSYWPNPFQDNAIMMVVETGEQRAGSWVTHKRNVAEDFKTLFGEDISTLHGYAVMVDGDNTGNTTTSWFDNLSFTAAGNAVLQ